MDSLWYKYKNSSKRKRQTLHSLGVGFAFFVLLYILTKVFNVSLCVVKNLFGVSCFGCGLTRGFIAVLRLDFKAAFEYNVLSVLLFLSILIYCGLCVVDIVFDKEYILKIENQLAKKYMYVIYVMALVIAAVLNNRL